MSHDIIDKPTYSLLISGIFTFFLIEPVTIIPTNTYTYRHTDIIIYDIWEWSHQLEPWGAHGPRHTQQYSQRQVEHTIWLHPPFFSMVALHFGHSWQVSELRVRTRELLVIVFTLVLTWIQFDVSLSSSHFFFQRWRYAHRTGSCGDSAHLKLKQYSKLTHLIN